MSKLYIDELEPVSPGQTILYLRGTISADGFKVTNVGDLSNPTDEKLKITSSDNSSDTLADKLVAGTNVTLTIQNPGGNEKLEISSSDFVNLDQSINNDAANVIASASGIYIMWVSTNPLIRTDINYTNGSQPELIKTSSSITTTKDNADTVNIYEEGGYLMIQNKLGSAFVFNIRKYI